MSMRYTGPNADYPVYCCRSDRDSKTVFCARKSAQRRVHTYRNCIDINRLRQALPS